MKENKMKILPYRPPETEYENKLCQVKPGQVFKHYGKYYLLLEQIAHGVYSYVNLQTFKLEEEFMGGLQVDILESQLSIKDKDDRSRVI